MSSNNQNLFVALHDAFPADLDTTAVETADGPRGYYTWRDLDRGSARIANFLQWLDLPAGARIAVQVEKSVEALMLYLGVLRAGHVVLPLNHAYQSAELEYFIRDAEPSVVVCSTRHFSWTSRIGPLVHAHIPAPFDTVVLVAGLLLLFFPVWYFPSLKAWRGVRRRLRREDGGVEFDAQPA